MSRGILNGAGDSPGREAPAGASDTDLRALDSRMTLFLMKGDQQSGGAVPGDRGPKENLRLKSVLFDSKAGWDNSLELARPTGCRVVPKGSLRL